jgi:hypothetical protein
MSPPARRIAALAAFAAAAIFITQEICLRLAADPSSADELVRVGVSPINLLRARLMFLLFFFWLTVYTAIYAHTRKHVALLGLIFGVVSCIAELGYRAVELDGLFARWLPAYLAAQGDAARLVGRARLDTFYDLVPAAYRIIGIASPLASLCFGLATFRGRSRLERAVGILFFVNVGRKVVALAAGLLPWLASLNNLLFAIVVIPLYVVIGIWLWRTPPVTAVSATP